MRGAAPSRTIFLALAAVWAVAPGLPAAAQAPEPDMVWIPGAEFTMGSAGPLARPDEAPPHRVRVDGFWMDATEVTNAQFGAFVAATGYKTIAERPVDWEELKTQLPPGTPKPPGAALQPGSLVFTAPEQPVAAPNHTQWWRWVNGADWRHPTGPGSDIEGLSEHPVVHIAWEDAAAFASWAHKRLPTEAEWELAARGGLEGATYCWGEELTPDGAHVANIWQGAFPSDNTGADGYLATAPVRAFPPNAAGLYAMAGNVWEWTADWYRPDTYAARVQAAEGAVIENPIGPSSSFDPREPLAPRRTQRGGSFLCHVTYCASYRPSARMGGTIDSGASHIGFRCIMDAPAPAGAAAPEHLSSEDHP
jgi:formylglycine-generating enzyme required for sulfatase activity